MLLGIISDTHDQEKRTAAALRLLHDAGAQSLIHCGDITQPNILALFSGTPTYYVQGNNDDDDDLRRAWKLMDHLHYLQLGAVIELAGKRLGVTHGHLRSQVHELFSQAPDYLLTGHSHIALDERHGQIRRINPGALYRARHYSVAVLNLLTDELRFLAVPH
jgi:putative phosphoesterase